MILADFTLPRTMRRTLAHLAPVVCPSDLESLGILDQLLGDVELLMRSMPAYLRVGLVAGATSFELGAMAFPSSLGRPFSLLPKDKAEGYFRSWWDSPIGAMHQLAKGLKAALVFAYWENPTVRVRMAYHPERWIADVARRRLESYAEEIRRKEAEVTAPDPLQRTRRWA